MRYVFGPAFENRVRVSRPADPAAAAAAVLLSITISGPIDDVDGVEHVPITLEPAPTAPAVRPVKVFAVYSPAAPSAGDDPEAFITAPGHYTGSADIPAEGDTFVVPVPNVPEDVAFHVQTVLVYPDAA